MKNKQVSDCFEGEYFYGEGDVEYLYLLDVARRMFGSDPEFQNIPMLYTPAWNGLVEGPKWGAWWIQNSYGPTYCALPFYTEPYTTFLQNSQDAWFDNMGDGKSQEFVWRDKSYGVVPDGALCDAATPGGAFYKQGDGRVDIHDWGMEFTAAGLLMQAELLLISRDAQALAHYLPKLERCANFIETRRDPKNNLFLAGPAGNLLAPSYAGWKKPDGTYGKSYLAGLSVTYIAALDRLIELEKLVGENSKAQIYAERRDLARKGLPLLTTDEGYLIKSLAPDGTPHGVYGAEQYGYFEAVANHDAICFRVVDGVQAQKIYDKIAAIPGLRPHDVIITNYPSLDDMYEDGGIFRFGIWVNGGHWSTCEARMVMGYYRLGKYEDARRSMKHMLRLAQQFQMDNPLKDFGKTPWFDKNPINLCYDSFGSPAAMIRGLFEYIYRADGLTLIPHVPLSITRLEQRFPVRFGDKKLYLSVCGAGAISSVNINGQEWGDFNSESVFLPYDKTPGMARIQIALGDGKPGRSSSVSTTHAFADIPSGDDAFWNTGWISEAFEGNELPLRIGADSNGGSRFVGDIARIQIFDGELSADEIAALTGDKPVDFSQEKRLLCDLDFENQEAELFVNTACDESPAKIVGDVEVVDSPMDKAIRLSGGGFLEISHDEKLNLSKVFTLAAYIRPKSFPQGGTRIIDKIEVGASNGYLLDTFPGGSLRMITPRGTLNCDAKLPLEKWSHVSATFNAQGELKLYVNGKMVASTETATPKELETFKELPVVVERLRKFYAALLNADLGESYEEAHAKLTLDCIATIQKRRKLLDEGKISELPAQSQKAADLSYIDTAVKHCAGLTTALESYADSENSDEQRIYEIWNRRD